MLGKYVVYIRSQTRAHAGHCAGHFKAICSWRLPPPLVPTTSLPLVCASFHCRCRWQYLTKKCLIPAGYAILYMWIFGYSKPMVRVFQSFLMYSIFCGFNAFQKVT